MKKRQKMKKTGNLKKIWKKISFLTKSPNFWKRASRIIKFAWDRFLNFGKMTKTRKSSFLKFLKNYFQKFPDFVKIPIFEKSEKKSKIIFKLWDVFSGSSIFWKSSSHKGKTSHLKMSLFTRKKATSHRLFTGKNRDNLDTRRGPLFP